MRWWLLLVSACATTSTSPAPRPRGVFVANLIERRVAGEEPRRPREMLMLASYRQPATELPPPRMVGEAAIVEVEFCIDESRRVTSVRAPGAARSFFTFESRSL